ncbi:MAG: tetratricopeptide repeat protein [Terriglobia bacterium]
MISNGSDETLLWRAAILLLAAGLALPLVARAQAGPVTVESVIEALRTRNDSRALALCQDLTRSQPRDPRLWTLEGMALEGLGRNEDGLKSLDHALEIDPDYVPALEAAAQIQFHANMPKAQPYLKRLIRLDPRNETAHAMLAALAFKRKDCAAAATHFEQSRAVISNNSPALAEFGACLVRMDRFAEAIPVFRQILDLRAGDWKSQYNLGLVQLRAHQYQDSIQTLLPLTQSASANAAALNLIAAAYEANGQTPQAVAALRKGMALAPRDAGNYLDLATICLDHGSFGVGVDILKAGLRALPDSGPLYLELGVLLVQMGRFEEADADFRKAAALRPAQNTSTVALGISLLQEDKPGESLQLVRRRLAKAPNDPVLNYLLAEILLRKGIQPGTPAFEEAVAAAQRSVRNKGDFVPAQDVLAELYLRAGQVRRAAEASHRALSADPTDQSALYHLVLCARKEGDRKQASQLTEKLAQVSAAAQKRDAARNRFRLVEEEPGPSREQEQP